MGYVVEETSLSAGPALAIRETVPMAGLPAFFGAAFHELTEAAHAGGARIVAPPFARYHSVTPRAVDVEAVLPLDLAVGTTGRAVHLARRNARPRGMADPHRAAHRMSAKRRRLGLLGLLRFAAKNARYFRAMRLKDRVRTALCLANIEIAKLDPSARAYAARVRELDAAVIALHQGKWHATAGRWREAFRALRRARRLARALARRLRGRGRDEGDLEPERLESHGTEIDFAGDVPLVPSITPIIVLQGSDFEMGRQYAQQLVEIFGRWILERHAGTPLSAAELDELGRWEEQHRRHTPWLLELCRGWAAGAAEAGVPMSYAQVLDLWVGHRPPAADYLGGPGLPELPPLACSGVAAWGRATTDGRLVTGSTGDHDLSFQVTLVAFPERGNAFIYSPFGATGEIGGAGAIYFFGHPGINSKGLAYVHHGGGPKLLEPRRTWGYGIRRAASVIHALRFCDDAREAQRLESSWPIGDVGFGDQNTVGGFWADDHYGYVCESRREPLAIREAGMLGETDFLYANNSVAHPRAIESEWLAKDRELWTWDAHGGFRPKVATGMKKSLGLFLAFASGRLSTSELLGRGMRYAYTNSCARNRYLFHAMQARLGRVDVDAMKEVYRTGGTLPAGPWRRVVRDFTARGVWGDVSAAHASNAMTVVTKPGEGRYCLCTGPARRGLAPMMPNAALAIRGETNAFWEIRLGAEPAAMVREAAALARDLVARAGTGLVELAPALAELAAGDAVALDGSVAALSRALRCYTRAQVRAQQAASHAKG